MLISLVISSNKSRTQTITAHNFPLRPYLGAYRYGNFHPQLFRSHASLNLRGFIQSCVEMARIPFHVRKSVVLLHSAGHSVFAIHKHITEEGVSVSVRSVYKLCRKFCFHGSVLDLPRRKRSKKLTTEMEDMIDEAMKNNDELTSEQLRTKLKEKYPFLELSLSAIKVACRSRGWICTKPHYCQILWEVNKVKRLEWCKKIFLI